MLAACRGEADRPHTRLVHAPGWTLAWPSTGGCASATTSPGSTRTPELCAQVTTMPVDTFGVDGAVLYADIMLPLFGMGVPFSIDPGSARSIHEPVRDAAAVEALRVVEAEEATPDLFGPSACSAATSAARPPVSFMRALPRSPPT